MDANRRSQISRVYHAALEHSADDRRAFLDGVCEGDELFGITSVYHNKHMYAEGLEAARAYAAGVGYDEAEALLARHVSSADYPQAMAQAADALAARSRSTFVSPFDVGTWYTYAGDKQRALEWLEKGYLARDPSMPYIALPEFDTLRGEPRFQELLRRMKLPS